MITDTRINDYGIKEDYIFHEDGSVTETHTQDISILLDSNKNELNYGNNGYISKDKNMRKLAEIDYVTMLKLKNEYDIDLFRFDKDDAKKFKNWLNHPDNRKFLCVKQNSFNIVSNKD